MMEVPDKFNPLLFRDIDTLVGMRSTEPGPACAPGDSQSARPSRAQRAARDVQPARLMAMRLNQSRSTRRPVAPFCTDLHSRINASDPP